MSMEDILRAARKANGEQISPKPHETPAKSSPPKYDMPKKWYEKHWLIWFLLIFLYPVGLMMLWAFSRYTKKVKTGITIATLALFLVGYGGDDFQRKSSLQSGSSYDERDQRTLTYLTYQGGSGSSGYLRKGVKWLDKNGEFHYITETVMVEIGKEKIVASNGRLTQIYFIAGENAGQWGYVSEKSISLSR